MLDWQVRQELPSHLGGDRDNAGSASLRRRGSSSKRDAAQVQFCRQQGEGLEGAKSANQSV
jgi:hypothetical protein